ncbi:MAG: Haloacid dehalogenase [Promethearchaeota archaeon]|nr:MAG: Haloacid dehalogenase [Candidatus Lokiarchaeota archaeon]
MIDQYNLILEECIYLDDLMELFKPAEGLGLKIIDAKSGIDFRKELSKFDIDLNS